jgi:hypothetical protein
VRRNLLHSVHEASKLEQYASRWLMHFGDISRLYAPKQDSQILGSMIDVKNRGYSSQFVEKLVCS